MGRHFSEEFKKQAVEKALNRSPNQTLRDISKSLEIGQSSLGKWIKKFSVVDSSSTNPKELKPSDWTFKQKLEAVLKTHNLTETELAAYCREHGIYSHHVADWQKEFENMASPQEQLRTEKNEKRQLKAEVKSLQKELMRKEKALAEASALLILQKKAQLIWGETEVI